jgi:hypothetical protein
VIREDPVGVGLADAGLSRVDLVDPAGLQPHEEPLERLVVVGRHGDHGVGRVVGLAADVEAVDAVVAAVLPDVVQDPRQDAVIHQVSGDLDGLVGAHPSTVTKPAPPRALPACGAPESPRESGRAGLLRENRHFSGVATAEK